MRILDTNQFYQSSRHTLNQFKSLVYNIYNVTKLEDSEFNQMINNVFSDEEVKEAIQDLSLDMNNYIVIDNHIRSNLIIRYLEFGGEALKAPHILSKAKQRLRKGGV